MHFSDLLMLFWSFVKIGFTSFGGLSMIPLITDEVVSNGWMVASEVSDIVAIAEMTPGPLGLNCATFAGIKAAGLTGAVVANLGILMPTLTICMAAAVFFGKFKNSSLIRKMLIGIRPACLGLVIGVMISLGLDSYISSGSADLISIGIGICDAVLLLKFKMSVPAVILLSAAAGLLIWGVIPLII